MRKTKSFYYRLVLPAELEELFCIPAPEETHGETSIPKNTIVELEDKYKISFSEFCCVKYEKKKFLVTNDQFEKYFFKINIRK